MVNCFFFLYLVNSFYIWHTYHFYTPQAPKTILNLECYMTERSHCYLVTYEGPTSLELNSLGHFCICFSSIELKKIQLLSCPSFFVVSMRLWLEFHPSKIATKIKFHLTHSRWWQKLDETLKHKIQMFIKNNTKCSLNLYQKWHKM